MRPSRSTSSTKRTRALNPLSKLFVKYFQTATTGGFTNALAAALEIVLAPQFSPINATIARGQAVRFNVMAELYEHGFRGLPKTVAGSGVALATAVAVGGVQVLPATNSAVNTVCPLLLNATTATIIAFSHELVEYYNENFGIVPGDTVTQRQATILLRCYLLGARKKRAGGSLLWCRRESNPNGCSSNPFRKCDILVHLTPQQHRSMLSSIRERAS
ncbi:hypothetical protein B0H16DRAFT_1476538 [Mycena metata]|uniref:Uncharacterized protein n=1 Tax=Mycena metata TaxID=1033252 RepID=A0AAD7MGQ1_9AGAR|nr:hypothetical protein B0H16DRAFT_1476538 [Mycena metata]